MSKNKHGRGWLPMRRPGLKTWVLVGLAVVVGGWLVWSFHEDNILRDRYSDDPLKYEKLGPPYFYRLTFRATFDGAPVLIDQVGECRPYVASGGMGGGYTLDHQLIPKYAGQRLPDGSAFYIRMPSYCFTLRGGNKAARWRGQGTQTVLPQGFWVDSLEDTTVIETYATARYFEEPEARIRVEEGRVEFLESGVATEAQDVASFAAQDRPYRVQRQPDGQDDSRPKTRRYWQLLRISPEFRAKLPAQPIAVSQNSRFKVFDFSQVSQEQYFNTRAAARYGTKLGAGLPLDFPQKLMESWDIELVRIGEDMYSEMIPLRWKEGRYHVSVRPRGYITWQLAPGKDPLDLGGAVSFIIDGDPLNVDMAGLTARQLAFLDTQNGAVYVMLSL